MWKTIQTEVFLSGVAIFCSILVYKLVFARLSTPRIYVLVWLDELILRLQALASNQRSQR